MRIFVDTSYYVARLVSHDQWHAAAKKGRVPLSGVFTSSLVVNETISLLQSRGFLSEALSFLSQIRATDDVQIICPDAVLQSEAWDLFQIWGGSGPNAVDCVSFAIMKRYGIKKAFTFDTDFHRAGFEILKK